MSKLTSASNTSLSVLSDQSEDSPVTTNSDPFEIPAKTSFESENADTSWSSTGISEYKDKEEDNKVEESGEYDGGSMLDEETNGCTLELPPIKSKKKVGVLTTLIIHISCLSHLAPSASMWILSCRSGRTAHYKAYFWYSSHSSH